jgi:hypothetical protein
MMLLCLLLLCCLYSNLNARDFLHFRLLLIIVILVEVLEGLDNQFGTMESILEQESLKQKVDRLTKENIFYVSFLLF